MCALRRASIHPRNRGLSSETARILCGKSEIAKSYLENYSSEFVETQEKTFGGLQFSKRFFNPIYTLSKSFSEVRTFSSHVGTKSGEEGDDDLEDGCSELETPHDMVQETSSVDGALISESELAGEEDDPGEAEVGKESSKYRTISSMTRAILTDPSLPASKVLDKWVEEGNEVTQVEVSSTMCYLRKRRMYTKALQISEWLESSKLLEFIESNYASRVDSIGKVHGAFKAEEYMKKIPESFKGELVYGTLLANYVFISNVKKSKEVFNKMKSLGFPITQFSCNQMILLYRKTDRRKIADVLLLMDKENVKPSYFIYNVLIDIKGQSNDITDMEQIVETMKDEGLVPTIQIKASLARHYANARLKDKSEAILKEIEGNDLKKNRWACKFLLPIYASLGREDEVTRIWDFCEPDARATDFMAGIEAWGKLNRVEKAEELFDKMMKLQKKTLLKQFVVLLKVYADNKMLEKGKNLVKQMEESGCPIGPLTWDALVKLYIGAGEVENADSMLEKASKHKKAMFTSYFSILDSYAKRGDIKNTEKMFLKMRQVGYAPHLKQYSVLLQAYINAKVPAYGFVERMNGDKLVPSSSMRKHLAQVDPLKKSGVSQLLD